jgi:hypothetical protein
MAGGANSRPQPRRNREIEATIDQITSELQEAFKA